MEFADFADRAAAVEAESADTEIVALVRDLFLAADPPDGGGGDGSASDGGSAVPTDDLPVLARFVQGQVFPAWKSTTLDVGPSLCYEAIARAAGPNVDADDVEERLADVGDVGEVAASYDFGGQRGLGSFGDGGDGTAGGSGDGLTVTGVAASLQSLAEAEGTGSRERKLDLLFGLFNRASSTEARYLARLILSEMRIGVGEGTVRDAVAAAFDVPVEAVERALQVSNDYGRVAVVARDRGREGLDAVELEIGRPVRAMLAQAGTVADAVEEWGTVAVETKYDGARVQVHYDGEAASVFSRNMEDVTDPLPEVVEFVERAVEDPVILDGEVVAVGADGEPLPFQEVLRRFRRKHDVARMREEVEVELRAFDCLHADGADLIEAPLTERRERLAGAFGIDGDGAGEGGSPSEDDGETEAEGGVADAISELTLSDAPEEIAAAEADALDAGHEGIMLKNPESAYTPGRRGKNWLKRKPDVETLDLVVTGAEWGEGRRAEFLGTFELSVRTDDGFETVGKVATGITDEKLAELTDLLEPEIVSTNGQSVDVNPSVVFEVGYEEIQASPTYSSGYALRFPRFAAVRDDKTPEEADSLTRVERLADQQ